MSKKKVASRSTMTLKDFHGGSIPSDLPLPSAPGMTVDRSAYERQGSGTWMSPTLGRGYGGDRGGYSRQGSSNAVRTFEDKASYFPNPANIGRNYDEDERKPVDGRPRSSHSADRYDDHGYEERRGGFSMDRYSLEDQGSFGSAPGSYVESRTLGSADRFPPSQVVGGGGFESDNYVHDEFGLIPVGPPPGRVSREIPPRQQPSYQRELIQTPPEQPAYGQSPPASSLPSYPPQPQPASSPPRSWRNPSHQQPPTPVTRPPQESATNVWTARREGEFNRTPSTEASSESVTSTPWRPQSSAAKLSEASAVDKVSSGRWQSDAMRPSGRTQGPLLTPVGRSEEPNSQSLYAREYPYQSPYAGDGGRGAQPADASQGDYEETNRGGPVGDKRTTLSQAGKGGVYTDPGKGEGSDRIGYADEQGTSRSLYSDGGAGSRTSYAIDVPRRSYPEERWGGSGGYSETGRGSNVEVERIVHPETGRGGYSELGRSKSELNRVPFAEGGRGLHEESERVDISEQSRPGFTESNRFGRSVSQYGTGRSRHPDEEEGSFPVESGQVMYTENGRSSYAPDSGNSTFSREETRGGYGSDGNRASYGDGERSRSPYSLDRAGAVSPDTARPAAAEVWRPGYSAPSPVDPTRTAQVTKLEPAERPKLKLLPRSKPLERETINPSSEDAGASEKGVDARYVEEKRPAEILSVETERSAANELGTNNATSEVNEENNRKVERPKLNLKPRTQPTEAELVEGSQKVRQVVFGGARPRELVLKERGVDDPLSTPEAGQTPLTASVQSSNPNALKSAERTDVVRVDRQESWGEEKQENRRYERPDRGFEKQAGKEGNRVEREDTRRDQERVESRRNPERFENRREPDRTEPRRDGDGRRDIDKQDSWRRPLESPVVASIGPRNASSTVSSLVDSTPRSLSGGKFGYTAPASAVELAQAFSRSSSIGSTMTGAARGANSLRSPLTPIPKSAGQGYGSGYANGLPSPYGPRDAPFSRLAEAPPPPPAAGRDMYLGGGFGGDGGLTNGYASGKLGAYGGGDTKNSFGRSELTSGREREEYDDFPGKRGLPLRQKEGYYD